MRQIRVWWISCFPSAPSCFPRSCCHQCCLFHFKSCLPSDHSHSSAASSQERHFCSPTKSPVHSGSRGNGCCWDGMGAARQLWPLVPAQGGGFCWSQMQALDAYKLQTWQPCSIVTHSFQIAKQFGACLRSCCLAEDISLFFCFFPLVLRIFFKMSQTDSLWAEVFLKNKIKGPY